MICQRKYSMEILQDATWLTSLYISYGENFKLSKDQHDLLHDPTAYRWLIGPLLYLIHTSLILHMLFILLVNFLTNHATLISMPPQEYSVT